MIFQFTWQKVLNGSKTQTRRIVKPNHEYDQWDHKVVSLTIDLLPLPAHMVGRKTTVYQVGKTYAVQPGRGKAAVGRIEITGIKREDVRDISNEDVRAEGYKHVRDFLHVWCGMHDPSIENGTWGETKLMSRPKERYTAWVIQFKLVEVTK
jgi:hypothetical protein